MDKSLIEKYKAEMLDMYRSAQNANTDQKSTDTVPVTAAEEQIAAENTLPDSTGKLIVIVTTVRSLYPLSNARVTVFTGDLDNMQVAAQGVTDESGRTETFVLKTPAKALSMSSGSVTKPYASYNIEIKAEGYVDSIYLNVPVFSGVTSIQRANMLSLETAGKDKGPLIFDETQQFSL